MNWEHTDIAMAPRAGRVDELRAEAANYRQIRGLIREKRSTRFVSLRSRLAARVAALGGLIRPNEQASVTKVDRGRLGSRASH